MELKGSFIGLVCGLVAEMPVSQWSAWVPDSGS